jgi:formate--tetrahydrofolate ligase
MHIGMTDIEIARFQASGYGHYPASSPRRSNRSLPIRCRGAPSGHVLPIQEVYLAGAEFPVVLCGHIMTMPGLPKQPAAERIDVDERGVVIGLF